MSEKIQKPNSKKFVVAINEKHIGCFEAMPQDLRENIINKALSDYKVDEFGNVKKQKEFIILKHLLVIIATIFITFPLMFFAINQSLKFTVKNYCQINTSFEKIHADDTIGPNKLNYSGKK